MEICKIPNHFIWNFYSLIHPGPFYYDQPINPRLFFILLKWFRPILSKYQSIFPPIHLTSIYPPPPAQIGDLSFKLSQRGAPFVLISSIHPSLLLLRFPKLRRIDGLRRVLSSSGPIPISRLMTF